MNYTAKRLGELLEDLNFCSYFLESKMPNVAALPLDLPEIQEDIYHTVLKLVKTDAEVENVFKGMGLGPKTKVWKDYFNSGADTLKKNLILDQKIPYSSEILEKLVLFSGVKKRVLETLLLGYENTGNDSVDTRTETAKNKSAQDDLALYLKEWVGIYRRGSDELIIEADGTRRYLFLEACIKVRNPDFTVDGDRIYRYLVQHRNRLPKRNRKIENKSPEKVWAYIRQCYYDLQHNGVSDIGEFITLERYSSACLRWKSEKVS